MVFDGGLYDSCKSVFSVHVAMAFKFLGCPVEEKIKFKDFACFYENTNSKDCPIFFVLLPISSSA